MQFPRAGRSQDGMTLVAILVAAALIATIMFIASSAITDRLRMIGLIKGGDAIREIEDYVRVRVREVIGDYVEESRCGSEGPNFAGLTWNSSSDYKLTWLQSSTISSNLNYVGNAAHEAAKERCKTRQTFTSGTENIENAESIYVCLLIEPNTGAPPTTILRRGSAFAEFSVRFLDFGSGDQRTCSNLLDLPNDGKNAEYLRGLVSFYSLYWRGGTPNAISHFATSGNIHTKMHY